MKKYGIIHKECMLWLKQQLFGVHDSAEPPDARETVSLAADVLMIPTTTTSELTVRGETLKLTVTSYCCIETHNGQQRKTVAGVGTSKRKCIKPTHHLELLHTSKHVLSQPLLEGHLHSDNTMQVRMLAHAPLITHRLPHLRPRGSIALS